MRVSAPLRALSKSAIPKAVQEASLSTSKTLPQAQVDAPLAPTWYKHARLNQGQGRKLREIKFTLSL